jgi:hypothetical protein
MAAGSAGCSLFKSHKAPVPPPEIRQGPAPAASLKPVPKVTRPVHVHASPVSIRKQVQPHLAPEQPPAPAPVITLENGDAKSDVQRLVDQVTLKLAHINRADLPENAASTYQQANELITAAKRAMADQDYVAASSLAEKASALTSQLPLQK